jgi:hypothetical protein
MNQEEISEQQAIQIEYENARKMVEDYEALKRLKLNPDFKRIIMDGYLKSEAIRLVYLKGDTSMYYSKESNENRQHNEHMLQAIGAFNFFLYTIEALGKSAQNALNEHLEG